MRQDESSAAHVPVLDTAGKAARRRRLRAIAWLMSVALVASLLALPATRVWLADEPQPLFRVTAMGMALDQTQTLFSANWSLPVYTLWNLLWGLIVIAGVWGTGFLILKIPALNRAARWPGERVVLAPLVGAVAVSLATLGVGLVTLRGQVPILILGWFFVIGSAGLAWEWHDRHVHRRRAQGVLRAEGAGRLLAQYSVLLAAAVAAVTIIYALAPAVESDELRYHLSAPAIWLREGRIQYLPHQAFSNFPMLTEMLYLLALSPAGVTDGGSAKLIHAWCLLLSAGLVGTLCIRSLRRDLRLKGAGAWAAVSGAALVTIPSAAVLAGWGFIDLAVTAYVLGFVYSVHRLLKHPTGGWAMIAGLIAGGALGVKYSMVPLIGLLALTGAVLLAHRLKGDRSRALKLIGVCGLTAVLAGAPWYLKNWVWTGNPVYPLAWGVFGGGEWSAAQAELYHAMAGGKGVHLALPGPLAPLAEWLLSPWFVTVRFEAFEHHLLGATPLIMLVIVLAWLAAARRRITGHGIAWLASALVISWVVWFASYRSVRILLPTVALLLVLGGRGLAWWLRMGPLWAGRFAAGMLGLSMGYGAMLFVTVLGLPAVGPGGPAKADALACSLGFMDREIYLKRNVPYYDAAQWLSGRMGRAEAVLLVGEHRTFHFDVAVMASDWFDTPQPFDLMRGTADNDELLDRLLAGDGEVGRATGGRSVRYLFLNEALLMQWRRDSSLVEPKLLPGGVVAEPRLSAAEFERLGELLEHPRLREIYDRGANRVRIYEILKSGEGARTGTGLNEEPADAP